MDLLSTAAGFGVGMLVGLTGVGGGSLMAPILILVFGVAPVTAVGTDLLFASITKSVGAVVHHRKGTPDLRIFRLLCYGSLPAAVVTVALLSMLDMGQAKQGIVMQLLGAVLLLTAIAMLVRHKLQRWISTRFKDTGDRFIGYQPALTILAGAVLGVMVTLTSVGAGALGAAMLIVLYPFYLTSHKLVGTDILHAVPLTLVAGIGHLFIGSVNFSLLGALLIGSIPGIVIGSLFGSRAPERLLNVLLAIVLALVGLRMVW